MTRRNPATRAALSLPNRPRRIVTLTPALAEQVCALGLSRRLAGVSIRSEHPPSLSRKPCVGSLHDPGLERILALRPDLVLASRELNRQETVRKLRRRNVRVVVVPAYSTCAHVLRVFCRLGARLGRAARARRIAARAARILRPREGRSARVFVQVWTRPLLGIAGLSYIHEFIKLCGGKNVLAGRRGRVVQVSEREIVRANPEIILITLANAAPEIRRWRRHPRLAAAQNGRILAIPAYWVSPSPLALLRGARELRRILHLVRPGLK